MVLARGDLNREGLSPEGALRVVEEVGPTGGAAVLAGEAADEVEVEIDFLPWSQIAPVKDQLAAAQLPEADVWPAAVGRRTSGILELGKVLGQRQARRQTDDRD